MANDRSLDFSTFVHDFAGALKSVDLTAPQFTSRSGRIYQPGIGPHGEDRAVDLIATHLKAARAQYLSLRCRISYEDSRQSCDLVFGDPIEWMIEVKMARLLGDNGKPDDTAIKDVLSPFDVRSECHSRLQQVSAKRRIRP